MHSILLLTFSQFSNRNSTFHVIQYFCNSAIYCNIRQGPHAVCTCLDFLLLFFVIAIHTAVHVLFDLPSVRAKVLSQQLFNYFTNLKSSNMSCKTKLTFSS